MLGLPCELDHYDQSISSSVSVISFSMTHGRHRVGCEDRNLIK
jgi:hypothetical protein